LQTISASGSGGVGQKTDSHPGQIRIECLKYLHDTADAAGTYSRLIDSNQRLLCFFNATMPKDEVQPDARTQDRASVFEKRTLSSKDRLQFRGMLSQNR
jgi:hypothetical protein